MQNGMTPSDFPPRTYRHHSRMLPDTSASPDAAPWTICANNGGFDTTCTALSCFPPLRYRLTILSFRHSITQIDNLFYIVERTITTRLHTTSHELTPPCRRKSERVTKS